uniref:Uncharacterized protein n=1 Tax=Compsopogon caeruleus TaxID=31354 RepID=A0A7S1T910_9RHOD|mmetsp:Transcript_1298/g.2714  ORF Transcript_1298/g.2714 Transcript_1298/m.2714 type:complete len:105 (+) Transcript_1298:1921-2235(+)
MFTNEDELVDGLELQFQERASALNLDEDVKTNVQNTRILRALHLSTFIIKWSFKAKTCGKLALKVLEHRLMTLLNQFLKCYGLICRRLSAKHSTGDRFSNQVRK